MTRTRSTTTKTADTAPTPAKKATAKRTTPAKPRAPRTRAPRKTTPTLSLVKEDTGASKATVVDLRHRLPVRRRNFVGHHTRAQIVEARAALAAATAQLPVPHILWLAQIDGRAAARLTDGTHLIHTHERLPEFTALLRCPAGGLHTELITNPADLSAARTVTATCNRRHDDTDPSAGSYDWHKAITLGVQNVVPSRLSPLNAGLQTAKKATADTQSMSLDEIGAHIAAQLDNDHAKEHPQP